MPNFTAITLDRLLEPRSRNLNPKPPKVKTSTSEKKMFPPPPQPSPALYTIPATTPLPDSPSSFPPSPYIVNHKRRGPRLFKNLSQSDVGWKAETVIGNGSGDFGDSCDEELQLGLKAGGIDRKVEGANSAKLDGDDSQKNVECEDFFDLQDSMSIASSTDVDNSNGAERLLKPSTPLREFYDALEEISSEGPSRSSYRNVEEEVREMRLNLLMEMERRKQAEESLETLRDQWQMLSHHLSLVGLMLPSPPPPITEEISQRPNLDPVEDLYRQIVVGQLVASAIERGCSRAEVELEMEPWIEEKNFEITRLCDRVQYYEAANREMSQRNQEAVELARQQRNRHKRRQRWIWNSIGIAVTVGSAALAWSYFPHLKPPPFSEDRS